MAGPYGTMNAGAMRQQYMQGNMQNMRYNNPMVNQGNYMGRNMAGGYNPQIPPNHNMMRAMSAQQYGNYNNMVGGIKPGFKYLVRIV